MGRGPEACADPTLSIPLCEMGLCWPVGEKSSPQGLSPQPLGPPVSCHFYPHQQQLLQPARDSDPVTFSAQGHICKWLHLKAGATEATLGHPGAGSLRPFRSSTVGRGSARRRHRPAVRTGTHSAGRTVGRRPGQALARHPVPATLASSSAFLPQFAHLENGAQPQLPPRVVIRVKRGERRRTHSAGTVGPGGQRPASSRQRPLHSLGDAAPAQKRRSQCSLIDLQTLPPRPQTTRSSQSGPQGRGDGTSGRLFTDQSLQEKTPKRHRSRF